MGAGHSHASNLEPAEVTVRPLERAILVTVLVVVGVATLVGLVMLWPAHAIEPRDATAAFVAPGVTFHDLGVEDVQPPCKREANGDEAKPGAGGGTCGQVLGALKSGSERGKRVSIPVAPEVSVSGLRHGDTIEVMENPPARGAPSTYSFFSVKRDLPIGLLAGLFVLVVALVARVRGLLALVGLGIGAYVLVAFMLPALLDGRSGLAVAVVGSSTIMFVVLYLAHGISMRTSAALAGTLVGVGITAVVGALAVGQTRLSGIPDETGALLSGFVRRLDFQGLLTCAVIVAGLGILNDVTITQASAVWELRSAAPDLDRSALFSRAMRIGRDHIASTIYTIVFAYAGTALSVLLLLYFYQRPVLSLISTEQISEEIVRTLASAIGLVLAVPITTAIAVLTVGAPKRPRYRLVHVPDGVGAPAVSPGHRRHLGKHATVRKPDPKDVSD